MNNFMGKTKEYIKKRYTQYKGILKKIGVMV